MRFSYLKKARRLCSIPNRLKLCKVVVLAVFAENGRGRWGSVLPCLKHLQAEHQLLRYRAISERQITPYFGWDGLVHTLRHCVPR